MIDLLITLVIALSALAAVAIIAVQVGRTSRNADSLRYEHEWRQMTHKETMAHIESMKPEPPPPPPIGFSRLLELPKYVRSR